MTAEAREPSWFTFLKAFIAADREIRRAEVAHCVHVFIGQLDVCLICGTPNPASLR